MINSLVASKIKTTQTPAANSFEPAPIIELPKTEEQKARYEEARQIGEDQLKAGKVAIFVVAGGQGSRLGFDGPKGCFSATPIKKKSLFQIFAIL